MTPSIYLVRLKVSGWKGLKEPAEIAFGDSSWLIHGPNEAGKSSLFSALRFALFEYSAKGGVYSDGWVNSDSTQAEVEVALQICGKPYTIHKIRDHKKGGKTWLYDGIGADRQKRVEKNRDADNAIMQLIGASARKGRDPETPSSWGILAWLLAPQAMDTVTQARQHATQALGLGNAISAEFQQVKDRIDAFCQNTYGKSNSPLKNSELREAMDQVQTLQGETDAIESLRSGFEQVLLEMASLQAGIPSLEEALGVAKEKYETARNTEVDFATGEQGLETLQEQVNGQQLTCQRATESVEALTELDREIAELLGGVAEWNKAIGELEGREREVKARSQTAQDALAALTEQQKVRAASTEQNRQWLEAARHFKELDDLKAREEQIQTLEEEIANLEKAGPILSEVALDEAVQVAARLEQQESLLANLATGRNVRVSVEGALDATWVRDGLATEYEKELGFARELQVQSKEFTLTIRLGDDDQENDPVQERLGLREKLTELGFETPAALRSEMTLQQTRSREHQKLQLRREPLGDADTLAAERTRLESVEVAPIPDEAPPIETLRSELEALRTEAEEAQSTTDDLAVQRDEARIQLDGVCTDLENARAEHKSASDQLEAANGRRDRSIEKDGRLEARTATLDTANNTLVDLQSRLTRTTEDLAANKGVHDTELKRRRRVVRQAEKDLRNAETDIKARERAARELGGEDLHQRLITVQEQLGEARLEKDRVQRWSDAHMRLKERLGDCMVSATTLETAPVRDRVQRWLELVTAGHWNRIEMDSQLNVTRLAGRPPEIDGEAMGSEGLRQVIHALTRLAVAVKIYEDTRALNPNQPPVGIVMDESQSHVDNNRVKRLMHVFNEQIKAGSVQVIALSHRRDEFQNLQAMNYDIERREAYDLDED